MSRIRTKKSRNRTGKIIKVAERAPALRRVNLHAAGIDVGASSHFVAVPPESSENPVREFGVMTQDLHALADWLKACGVTSVAMESTGVYWIPLFEVLEARGFEVKLVDARKVKNVSGRKTDVLDCQWLQELHTQRGCFRRRFGQRRRSRCCGPICDNARCWCNPAPRTSSISRRHCSR